MDKRDKVLKGLDVCHAQYSDYYCSQCPYFVERNECMSMMLHHARDLLKAQEPRVMTPGEIAALKENDIVWYEQHGPDGDFIAAMVADGRESIGNASMGVKLRYLDQSERLWTSRPTDEQRAAVPWEAVTP